MSTDGSGNGRAQVSIFGRVNLTRPPSLGLRVVGWRPTGSERWVDVSNYQEILETLGFPQMITDWLGQAFHGGLLSSLWIQYEPGAYILHLSLIADDDAHTATRQLVDLVCGIVGLLQPTGEELTTVMGFMRGNHPEMNEDDALAVVLQGRLQAGVELAWNQGH